MNMMKNSRLITLALAFLVGFSAVWAQKEVVINFTYQKAKDKKEDERESDKKLPLGGVIIYDKSDAGARTQRGYTKKDGVFRGKLNDGTYYFYFHEYLDARQPALQGQIRVGAFDDNGNFKNTFIPTEHIRKYERKIEVVNGKVIYQGKQVTTINFPERLIIQLDEANSKKGMEDIDVSVESRTPKAGFENFDVILKIPYDTLDALKKNRDDCRIVAQPVWIDKDDNLTYYGEPMIYYFRDFEIVKQRESSFQTAPQQLGVQFFDEVAEKKAYQLVDRPLYDTAHNYNIATTDTLIHYSNNGRRYDDRFYFNIPMRVRVDTKDREHDCITLVQWVLTDYDHIIGTVHTDTILDGRNDPLKLLDYNVGTLLDENEPTYNRWFPTAQTGNLKQKAFLQLSYEVGSDKLDLSLGNNESELHKIEEAIKKVSQDRFAKTNVLEVMGWASPEGSEEKNRQLAYRRARALEPYIKRYSNKRINFNSAVKTWDDVIEALKADKKTKDVAKELEEFIAANKGKVLNFSKNAPQLLEKITPALEAQRVTQFQVDYSIEALLTGDTLVTRFDKDEESLRDREYITLYRHLDEFAGDKAKAEKVCQYIYNKKAKDLAKSPKNDRLFEMLVYANDLCAFKLMHNEGDTTLLSEYMKPENMRLKDEEGYYQWIPPTVAINQASAYLMNRDLYNAQRCMELYNKYLKRKISSLENEAALVQSLVDVNFDPENADTQLLSEHSKRNEILLKILKGVEEKDYPFLFEACRDSVQMNDTIAYNNLTTALTYGKHFVDANQTYTPDYNDEDLQEAATALRKALDADPSVEKLAFSQMYLKPAFKVMKRNDEDDNILLNVILRRYNNEKNYNNSKTDE